MPNKEVFLPTLEEFLELEQLLKEYQSIRHNHSGYNGYQYLKAKAIEKMIITSNGEDILRRNSEYIVDKDIAICIAKMYPKEVLSTPLAQNTDILSTILKETAIPSNHPLDNLTYFDPSIATYMKQEILKLLLKELTENPKYRFTYSSSIILDSIFNGGFWEYLKNDKKIYSTNDRADLYKLLAAIDPTYIIKSNLEEYNFWNKKGEYRLDDPMSISLLQKNKIYHIGNDVMNYCRRYRLPSLRLKDTLKTTEEIKEAKKLIKYLNIK